MTGAGADIERWSTRWPAAVRPKGHCDHCHKITVNQVTDDDGKVVWRHSWCEQGRRRPAHVGPMTLRASGARVEAIRRPPKWDGREDWWS